MTRQIVIDEINLRKYSYNTPISLPLGVIHKPCVHIFDPHLPSWPRLLNYACYKMVIWLTGNPTSPQLSTWFMDVPSHWQNLLCTWGLCCKKWQTSITNVLGSDDRRGPSRILWYGKGSWPGILSFLFWKSDLFLRMKNPWSKRPALENRISLRFFSVEQQQILQYTI